MEVIFEEDKHPVCAVAHPHIDNRLAIGFIDGNIGIYDVDMNKNLLTAIYNNIVKVLGGKRLKQAVRRLIFSQDGAFLYSAGENRSLCVYDLLNMKRIRCITESHGEKPSALSYLPSTSTKGQQVATGCENGEIKTWDLRSQNPLISTYNEQTEEINGFGIYKNTLLAAGADCILGAYDLRKRKLQVKSEVMHNELLCVEVGPKYTYVGSGDGYLEIFKNGEYGNILDRVACLKGKGVDCLKILQNNIVVTASCEEDQLRLFNVQPYQKLNMVGEHADGIGDLEISANKKWICSVGFWKSTIKFWDVENVLHKMLAIRDTALSGKKEWIKRTRRSSSFFDELCEECDDGRMDMDDGSDQEPSDLNELVDEGESIGSSDDDSTLLRKRRKVLVKSKYTRSGKRFKEHSDGVGGDDEMLNGSEDDGQEGDDGDGDDHDKDDSDDVDDGEEEDEDDDDDDVEDKA